MHGGMSQIHERSTGSVWCMQAAGQERRVGGRGCKDGKATALHSSDQGHFMKADSLAVSIDAPSIDDSWSGTQAPQIAFVFEL